MKSETPQKSVTHEVTDVRGSVTKKDRDMSGGVTHEAETLWIV
nr:hypothetical protein [Macrococcus caseolyticus]